MRSVIVLLTIVLSGTYISGCASKKVNTTTEYPTNMDMGENLSLELDDLDDIPLLTVAPTILDLSPEFKILTPEELFKPEINEKSDFYSNLIKSAFQYEGIRYVRGGLGEKGFDCSGFVYKTYSNFGIKLPRTSYDMSRNVIDIPIQEAQAGDLIFFKTNRRRNQINHVGLVIEVKDSDIKFIHASIKKGVVVSSTKDTYYGRTLAKIGRVQS